MEQKGFDIKRHHFILFIAILAYVFTCGGCSNSENGNKVSDYGSISFRLQWGDSLEKSLSPTAIVTNPDGTIDCAASDIATIDIAIYSPENEILGQNAFACTDGSGTIHNVLAGDNRRVAVLGKNNDDIELYQGEKTGISVLANQQNYAGVIQMSAISGVTVMIKDCIPETGSSDPGGLTVVDGMLYFIADNTDELNFKEDNGRELWISDGTQAGTMMVKDINPGPDNSDISQIVDFYGTAVFRASDGVYGNELWKSNGTEGGTVMVKDINPSGDSDPEYLTIMNGRVYFAADDGQSGRELWYSDGSASSTYRVEDINQGADGSNPNYLTHMDVDEIPTLFFAADDGTHGTELWKRSDRNSPEMVIDINPSGDSFPHNLLDVDGTLYFAASDGSGEALWKSDGTEAGTVKVKDIGYLYDFTNVNGTLFFVSDGAIYPALWKSDGTEAGTALVKLNGDWDNSPSNLTNVNGTLFYTSLSPYGFELYRSDGTEAGTVMVKDINPSGDSSPRDLVNWDGTVYFTATDGNNGQELWKSDGTEAGTVMVKNISAQGSGLDYYSSKEITIMNNMLYFPAGDDTHGIELWQSDGTEAGTVQVIDINVSGDHHPSFIPGKLTRVNQHLFFTATDGATGNELWVSNGAGAGTTLVHDINPSGDSNPRGLTDVNGTLFFAATDGNGSELWKSDGTQQGTQQVKDIYPGAGSGFGGNLVVMNGSLYFSANSGSYYGLYKSDGTEAGTTMVKELYGVNYPVVMNNELYFVSYGSDPEGYALWKSDGTEAGTQLVIDINPSLYGALQDLTVFKGELFFQADDGTNGQELWKSDGTEAGTMMVKDIRIGAFGSGIGEIIVVNDALYFTAGDGIHGYELWKTDGTETGTTIVKEIRAESGSSNPSDLTKVDNTLFFKATDDSHGAELWKSDGTEAGTVMVKDINPAGGSDIDHLFNINGTLFFTADDGTNGKELWISDGTEAGTLLYEDINPVGHSDPSDLVLIEDSLFFTAFDKEHGFALWRTFP